MYVVVMHLEVVFIHFSNKEKESVNINEKKACL